MSNSFVMTGRLTRDAEVREVGDKYVVRFSIVHDVYVTKDKPNVPLFVDTEWWVKNADIGNSLKKGMLVTGYGRLKPEEYEKDGETIRKIKFVVHDLDISFPPKEDGASESSKKKSKQAESEEEMNEEEVPF